MIYLRHLPHWRWTDVEQKAFDLVKAAISKDVILLYPDFSQPFEIHTDFTIAVAVDSAF